jgi:hypothetical protein
MTTQALPHSPAWVSFTYISFATSLGMFGLGILFLPLDIWIKGYFAMAMVLVVQASITMTKTLRDVQESKRMVNRIEDAKAERLLMEVERS